MSTGSESVNTSNTSSSHLPTKFSQIPNPHTFITSSMLVFSVIDVLALHLLFARPPTTSSSDRCFRYASPCLWSQLPLFLNQHYSGTSSSISYSAIPSPITFSSFDSPLWSSIIPPLFHSGLKPTCFTNLTSVVSLLPPNCLH